MAHIAYAEQVKNELNQKIIDYEFKRTSTIPAP